MKILCAIAVVGLLTGPVYAQMPQMNLLQDNTPPKTAEEKAAEEQRDKEYRDSLKKIPDAKASSDPWGAVRSDPPKATTKAATAKSRTRNGSTAN
jgi:hypothetical protein